MTYQGGNGWYTSWCEPVVVALFRRDRKEIERNLKLGWEAIYQGLVEGADAECLARQLTYNTFQAHFQWKDPRWEEVLLPRLLDELASPCKDEVAEGLRSRLYLQVKTTLDRFGVRDYSPDEMQLDFMAVPDREKTPEFWQYISKWAFKYEQGHYLELAYEAAVLTGRGLSAQWGWRRIDVMWRIINKSATTVDILKLIEYAQVVGHVIWIRTEVLPRVERLGLQSDLIDARLEVREQELASYTTENILALLRPHMERHSGTPSFTCPAL